MDVQENSKGATERPNISVDEGLAYISAIETSCADDGTIVGLCAALRRNLELRKKPAHVVDEKQAGAREALFAIRDYLTGSAREACETLLANLQGVQRSKPPILDASMGAEGMFGVLLEREPGNTPTDRLIMSLLHAKESTDSHGRSKSKSELAAELGIPLQELSLLVATTNHELSPKGHCIATKRRMGAEGRKPENLRFFIAMDKTGPRKRK